jgi:hypothetical protein
MIGKRANNEQSREEVTSKMSSTRRQRLLLRSSDTKSVIGIGGIGSRITQITGSQLTNANIPSSSSSSHVNREDKLSSNIRTLSSRSKS